MLNNKVVTYIITFIIGLLLGLAVASKQITKTEFKDKLVSVCDTAISSYEKGVCFAKDSCPLGIKTFTYRNISGDIEYICKEYNE